MQDFSNHSGMQENYPLKQLTTFKIGGPARYYKRIERVEEVEEVAKWTKKNNLKIVIIGGGSNLLVSDRGFDGLVIRVEIKGFERLEENSGELKIKVGAGEIWDNIVNWAVNNGWWGIENLSAIPGRVGGFIAQNAGAYGEECGEVLEKVEGYDIKNNKRVEFERAQCQFGYRTSIFSSECRDEIIILWAHLKLSQNGQPKIGYPDVKQYFVKRGIENPNLKQIRQAIIEIRADKLPNWGVVGNAGSFIKNIMISEQEYEQLYRKIKENFSVEAMTRLEEVKKKFSAGQNIKIPAAFLLDICGLKQAQVGGAAVHSKQPLVLINQTGQATADEVMRLFKKIRQVVYEKTGMKLEPETRLVGFSEQELEEYFKL